MNAGIDYGMGSANVDKSNGIRFGVISIHEVTQAWCDSSEPNYGEPSCPKCGGSLVAYDDEAHGDFLASHPNYRSCAEYACTNCQIYLDSDEVYSDEPLCHELNDGEYTATQGGDDSDIFITKSPYYTKCQFCSPCAPGAGYIMNQCEDGPRAYCFGHDWFEDNKAPYTVYRVADDSIVNPE